VNIVKIYASGNFSTTRIWQRTKLDDLENWLFRWNNESLFFSILAFYPTRQLVISSELLR